MAKQKIIPPEIYNTISASPTRSGKGVSSIVPTFLSCPEIISFMLSKSGTGKSSKIILFSKALAAAGKRILLVDRHSPWKEARNGKA
jgi:type IV secretory pathway TraG/TraD family ATPase VirD4